MMGLTDYNLTPKAKKCIKDAKSFAESKNHTLVNVSHLTYACITNLSDSCAMKLKSYNVDFNNKKFLKKFEDFCKTSPDLFNNKKQGWDDEINEVIFFAKEFSDNFDSYFIGVEHILYVIIDMSGSFVEFLIKNGTDLQYVKDIIESHVLETSIPSGDQVKNILHIEGKTKKTKRIKEHKSAGSSGSLDKYCINLNHEFLSKKNPVISGRDCEINELIEILSKKNKSNSILVGEAGVGKTAIIEGLAQKIVNQQVPQHMSLTQIFSVDISSMIAGTKYRGEFESRFKALLKEVENEDHLILFFDEIHTIIGAGNSEGAIDASSMLKPALARGLIKCIGATTPKEYKKFFEKDSAMKRRFEQIKVEEPSKAETKNIITNALPYYEDFHGVKYEEEDIDNILNLCESFLSNKNFPDKAFDVIDQVGAKTKIQYRKESNEVAKARRHFSELLKKAESEKDIDEEAFTEILKDYIKTMAKSFDNKGRKKRVKYKDIVQVISEKTGVSHKIIAKKSKMFSSFLKNMKSEIFGHDEILNKIYNALSCAKVGLNDKNKPLCNFLLVGSTGVGKTHTAKKISKYYFGNPKSFIQLNMSEYQDKTGVAKLIGANAGYIGYEEGGLLTEYVRNNPNSVILFDEIEKCESKILDLLLHILDEGYCTDNLNRHIDFSNTIIVMTSNIGFKEKSKRSMGFVQEQENIEDLYKKALHKYLRPELISRIDETLVFQDLKPNDLLKIISTELMLVKERLANKNIILKYSPTIKKCIFNELKSQKTHARDIKNLVKRLIQVPLSHYIVKNRNVEKVEIKVINKTITCV